jgi:hypothetical protein
VVTRHILSNVGVPGEGRSEVDVGYEDDIDDTLKPYSGS